MAKKTGTKHHVEIRLEDLNKMFKGEDVILIPKKFAKSIEFLLATHNVSLVEKTEDSGEPIISTATAEETASNLVSPISEE